MVYIYEERKGSNANGRRILESHEIPPEMLRLIKK